MNQYIITEEELLDTRSYIYHEDEVAFSRIESKVRSHPHQSERDTCPQNKIWQHCPVAEQIRKEERDKVLDLITTFRKEQSKELKIHDMWVAEAEYLKELRQAGEP